MNPKTMVWHSLAVLGALGVLLPGEVPAHGVEGRLEAGGMVVAASYQGGEAMSHARVRVLAPGSQQPFQTAHTDRNGRFAFVPDQVGTWTVVIADDLGHRLQYEVKVEDRHLSRTAPQPPPASGMAGKAWFGVSLLLCGAAAVLYWQARRQAARPNSLPLSTPEDPPPGVKGAS